MNSVTIVPNDGERIAFHVFTPALLYRLDKTKPIELPVMALRLERDNYEMMYLFDQIDCINGSSLEPLFDKPLPGTNGRGVAIMFTNGEVKCFYRGTIQPKVIDCKDRTPDQILNDVIDKYKNRPAYKRVVDDNQS